MGATMPDPRLLSDIEREMIERAYAAAPTAPMGMGPRLLEHIQALEVQQAEVVADLLAKLTVLQASIPARERDVFYRCSGLPKCGDKTCRHARPHEPEILLFDEMMCTNWCECASLDAFVGQRVYTRKCRCIKEKKP